MRRHSYSLNLWSTTGAMLFAVAKAVIKLKIELKAPSIGLTAAPYRESDLRSALKGEKPKQGDAKGLSMILGERSRAQEGCKVSEISQRKG